MQKRNLGQNSGLQSYFEQIIAGTVSTYLKLALQTLGFLFGYSVNALTYRAFGVYTGSVTLLAVFAIALCGDFLPAVLFSMGLALAADYFFIPPIGGIFENRASLEHFLVIAIVAVAANVLAYLLRAAYRATILAKKEATLVAAAMEKMLAHISHDIRNPLSSVKTMTQIIQRDPLLSAKNRNLSSRIVENLNRIDLMIQNLLDVSRMRAGKKTPSQYEMCDLQSIVTKVVEDFSVDAEVEIEFHAGVPIIGLWDTENIRRAIENLVTNAIKYGDLHRPIVIRVSCIDGAAVIEVHNEGQPIAQKDQVTLFDSFTRAANAESSKGWGLGLALVKDVVENHGGFVKAHSTKDAGTTFEIRLPLTPSPQEKL